MRELVVDDLKLAFSTGGWTLFLPHWLLMLATALLWSALLLWRARRMRKRKGMTNVG